MSIENTKPRLKVKLLREGAKVPKYAHPGDSGLDLYALPTNEALHICPYGIVLVPTGIAIELPEGYEGQVRPRSGLAIKQGLTVINTPGTIDNKYRGEIKVGLVNLSQETQRVELGDKIAQLVIAPVAYCEVECATELSTTERGGSGFGSSGK